ncbi:MAG: hypothetical protein ACYTDU_10335 [Planctomycetota bacterium]
MKAAEPFVRIRIRVPEAYLLLFGFDAKRPGLLVLDADGRRVAGIDLPGMGGAPADPTLVADLLDAAATDPPVEMFRVAVKGDVDAFREALEELESVEGTARRGDVLRIAVGQGGLAPAKVDALAQKLEVRLKWSSPIAVKPVATKGPGVWYATPQRSWVIPELLDPKALPPDLEARGYRLRGIPKGGTGSRVAQAPLRLPGVVAVFPDIFGEEQAVVGRKGEVDWKAVRQAFKQAGCRPQEKR